MIERPEAIIITMPVKFLNDLSISEWKTIYNRTQKEHILNGYRIYLQQMEATIADENSYWIHKMNNLPTVEVVYCYVTVLGSIMYRANIGGFEPGGHKIFSDGRDCYAKNWMILTHPFIEARPRIKRKGFQGFRYTEILF
jgi:hypothetical protein